MENKYSCFTSIFIPYKCASIYVPLFYDRILFLVTHALLLMSAESGEVVGTG